jgi:hypothetical protein
MRVKNDSGYLDKKNLRPLSSSLGRLDAGKKVTQLKERPKPRSLTNLTQFRFNYIQDDDVLEISMKSVLEKELPKSTYVMLSSSMLG